MGVDSPDCQNRKNLGAVTKQPEHSHHFPMAPYAVSSLKVTKYFMDNGLLLFFIQSFSCIGIFNLIK